MDKKDRLSISNDETRIIAPLFRSSNSTFSSSDSLSSIAFISSAAEIDVEIKNGKLISEKVKQR